MVDKGGQVDNQAENFHSGKRLRAMRNMRSLRHIDLSEEFNCMEDTIKKWQQRGIPQRKILSVANYFDLPKEIFSNDFEISEAEFENLLRNIKRGTIGSSLTEFENFLKNIRREVTDSSLPIPPPSGLPYENEEFPWEEVISGAGDEGTFHFYVGCKCNAEENFDQAIFNLNKALATDTLDGQLLHEAYYERGRSWYKKNDLNKALIDYVASLAPGSVNAPIPPAYDKDLNRPYKRPRFPWYGEDLDLKNINELDAIVQDIPTRATLYYIWGLESVGVNEYDSAIKEISMAIDLDPQSAHMADFLCAKGYALFQNGRYQDAIVLFTLVVDKKLKDSPEVLYFRALAYEKLNQPSDSIKDIEKCLEFDPNNELFLEKYRALEEKRSEDQKA